MNMLVQPGRRGAMVNVVRVKQCNQDIDIQQGPHLSVTLLFSQLFDQLVGDDATPRREGPEPVLRTITSR